MRFGVCGIEFRNIYKNKLFYMFSCVGDSSQMKELFSSKTFCRREAAPRIDPSLGIDPTPPIQASMPGDVITLAQLRNNLRSAGGHVALLSFIVRRTRV